MKTIIITENQLSKVLETAMDLDRYVHPLNQPFSNGNEDINDALYEIQGKIKELQSMFETGKKIPTEKATLLFKVIDDLTRFYNEVRYQEEFTNI